MKRWIAAASLILLAACGGDSEPSGHAKATAAAASSPADLSSIDQVAEDFVRLALAVGEHDPAFVDAYNGPEKWAEEAKQKTRSLGDLAAEAARLSSAIKGISAAEPVRVSMLRKQVIAAEMRIAMLRGETFTFNEETKRLYDAEAPDYDLAEFDSARAEIDALLPGDGPLNERVDAFRNSLAIPAAKRKAVFDAAIAECRRRTLAHFALPEGEKFELEFVTGKPWSGYNWYQGGYESLIQVNTDQPIVIDRAIDLGCHEGYPGHHTWNIYIERELLGKNGWIEYSIYPLFSPMSVMAEGSANYGIDLAFPGAEKIAFERDILFPIAGLDPAKAETLEVLNDLQRKLSHADNYVAREYLDGRISRDEAAALIMKYKLFGRSRAEQRVDFIETYRGYVINYNVGRDLVEAFVEKRAGNAAGRWDVFETLLSAPVTASDLAGAE